MRHCRGSVIHVQESVLIPSLSTQLRMHSVWLRHLSINHSQLLSHILHLMSQPMKTTSPLLLFSLSFLVVVSLLPFVLRAPRVTVAAIPSLFFGVCALVLRGRLELHIRSRCKVAHIINSRVVA